MKCMVNLVVVCHLLSIPLSVDAQTNNSIDPFREIGRKILTESKVFPLLRTQDDGQSSPEPSVSLLATNDGAAAKARFGYLVKDIISLDFTFTGPVSGGTAEFATHKGLGAGITAEGALRVVLYQQNVSRDAPLAKRGMGRALMNTNEGAQILARRNLTSGGHDLDDLVLAALDIGTGIQAAGGPAVVKRAARSAPVETLLDNPAAKATEGVSPQTLAGELNSAQGKEAFATGFRFLANDLNLWQVKRAVVLSVGGALSRPSFTLVDGKEFRSVVKKAGTGEFSLGWIESATTDTLTRGYYAGINISAGRKFSATARNTCLPVGDAGGTQCRNAVLRDPEAAKTELYQGDFRYFFDELKFAIGFRPGYDREAQEDEKWSIEVPVMFLQNSKDLQSALSDAKAGLTGGVTFGVKDSPNGRSFFAVFSVGSLFRLPGLPH